MAESAQPSSVSESLIAKTATEALIMAMQLAREGAAEINLMQICTWSAQAAAPDADDLTRRGIARNAEHRIREAMRSITAARP